MKVSKLLVLGMLVLAVGMAVPAMGATAGGSVDPGSVPNDGASVLHFTWDIFDWVGTAARYTFEVRNAGGGSPLFIQYSDGYAVDDFPGISVPLQDVAGTVGGPAVHLLNPESPGTHDWTVPATLPAGDYEAWAKLYLGTSTTPTAGAFISFAITQAASSIDIEKYVSVDGGVTWEDADAAPGPSAVFGADVRFKVVVCNTGDVTLTGIVVNDTDFTFTGVATSLAPGECDESDVYVVPGGALAGQQYDLADVVGTPPIGDNVTDEDPAYYSGSYPEPCIEVTKTVNCDEATVGATVTYHYCITNCSTILEMEITNIADTVLPDADVAAAFMTAHGGDDTLNPEEQVCFDVPYTILVTDPDPLENTIRVDAEDTTYRQATYDEDSASLDIKYPCLLLEKSCTSIDPVEKGGVAFFRISLTNCGDLPLLIDTTDIDDPDCDYFDGILPAGMGPVTCDLSIDIPADFTGTEFINHVMAEWSTIPSLPCVILIEGTENAQAPCEVTGGATRTPGFWKTHTDFAEHVLLTHCGGVLDLGFVELDSIDEICAYFWANKANNSDGSKRTKLCQARMHAAFHAIAALLNNCVPSGGGIPVDPAEIATILGGTDIDAIHELAGILAAYNESGDDVALIDPDASPGSATPQECRAYDQSIADCESLPKPGKGPK